MNLADIETQAGEFLARRRFHPWSAQDQLELDQWLAHSPHHQVAFWRLEATLSRTQRLAALKTQLPGRPVHKPESILPRLARTAAAIIVAALIGAYALQPAPDKIYTTPIGGHQIVTLFDGSTVELNTNSTLRITAKRTAVLEKGEAYFDIKHDETHPFIVTVAGHRVTDLGTKFLIRNGEKLEVALIEGLARIDSLDAKSTKRSALLNPGDIAIASKNTIALQRQTPEKLSRTLGWRQGLIFFDNTTLAEAAAQFNRYNNTKLIITDPKIAALTIGASFPVNDVERFARAVRILLGVKVEHNANTITLSR